jgi:hypothetical protein
MRGLALPGTITQRCGSFEAGGLVRLALARETSP